jgi:hypothetical protein
MLTKFIFLFGALKAALAFPINSFPGANSTDSSLHHKNSARGPGGVVVFGNQCYYDVWIWSMSSGVRLISFSWFPFIGLPSLDSFSSHAMLNPFL